MVLHLGISASPAPGHTSAILNELPERHEFWTASSSNPRENIEQAVRVLGGRLTSGEPGELVAEFGSRVGFRLLGGYIGNARRRYPIRMSVRIEIRTDGTRQASVTMKSNEGWYLVRLPMAVRLFDDRSDEILHALRSATEAAGGGRRTFR